MRAKTSRRPGLLSQILFQLFTGVALMTVSVSISTTEADEVGDVEGSKYDWQGTWDLSYKKEVPGPVYPWEFSRINDTFHARFAFSVEPSGTVKGVAYANLKHRQQYDGCASTQKNACVTRCKGEGGVYGLSGTFFVPETLPVTGQVHGQTVHLKLGPPADLVDVNFSSTCVGPSGTMTNNPKITFFCADLRKPCSASGHFLEIDMPLVNEARQPIHTTEVGGGEDGEIRITRNCRAMRGEADQKGFAYVSIASGGVHQDPSANSPVVQTMPHGSRIFFTQVAEKNGSLWYYAANSGQRAGWISSKEISCDRPSPLPPGKKMPDGDTAGTGKAHPTTAMTDAARG